MQGNSIDIKVFRYGEIEFPLNLDDMAVDARVDEALAELTQHGKAVDDEMPTTSKMRIVLDNLADALNKIFERDDAATTIANGETSYIGIMKRFAEAVNIIGAMRTEVFRLANEPFTRASEAAAQARKAKRQATGSPEKPRAVRK